MQVLKNFLQRVLVLFIVHWDFERHAVDAGEVIRRVNPCVSGVLPAG
jgi:hypothetical protein